MKPIDGLKAFGAGFGVLALNVLLTTLVIFVYAAVIERGHPPEYYSQMAGRIAVWTAPIGGALLMFAVGFFFTRRRPERNAFAFFAAVWLAYVLIDGASSLPMGGVRWLMSPVFFVHVVVSLIGGVAGVAMARR